MKNKSEKTVGYAVAICISAVLGIAGYFIFKYVLLGANACKIYPLGINRHSIIPDFIFFIFIAIIFLSGALICAFCKLDCKPIKRTLMLLFALPALPLLKFWLIQDALLLTIRNGCG